MCNSHPGERISSGIELHLQRQLEELCDRHCREFAAEGIEDLAAVIIDVHSGEVVARVGNSDRQRSRNGAMVDISASPRSSGSILKPLLYTAALQDGQILPNTLLKDTPVNIDGFKPRNFDRSYSGAVPASEALARSLNVPFVGLLRDYGVERFDELLRRCQLSSLKRRASDYGLLLILGGAEVRLDELCRAYANRKIQYLFICGSSLYLLDRLGHIVKGFPVQLSSEVLLGPDAYDFSGAGRYNIMVLNRDGSIDMYNLKGERPASWKSIRPEAAAIGLPELLEKGNRSWLLGSPAPVLVMDTPGTLP